ncbi:hypothetical protein M8J75_013631 [Diaphorina citri]|nr:hypothetical protein M8J75_013631 [Diaphorina citri]
MFYLKLSLVIVLLVCGCGLGRPNESDKEERLDMNDPDVQEAIEAAVNELSKHSDARFRRLRAWAVKKVDPADLEPNESSSGYEIKMRESRDCSKIKQTSPGACIQCNVFVYKKTTDKPPKYTITKMNCDPADLEANESSSGYEIKMREMRDCSRIKPRPEPISTALVTEKSPCIQCNVFVYKKRNEKPQKYTITKMNCVL